MKLTRDIAETPSKAYTKFDTSPSPLRDMTWIDMALYDPSRIQFLDSNKEIRPTSKKPKHVKLITLIWKVWEIIYPQEIEGLGKIIHIDKNKLTQNMKKKKTSTLR